MWQQSHLVQQYLAAVWGEVLQSGQSFAEDLEQAALHRQQGLLLHLLPLPSVQHRLLGRGLGQGPQALWVGQGARGQGLTVLSLRRRGGEEVRR